MRNKRLVAVVLFFIIFIGYFYFNNSFAKAPYNGFYTVSCIDNSKKPVRDYSFTISISILGKEQQIPKNFGHINSRCLYEIYAGNPSEIINVKTNGFKSFTLGNFFNVWKTTFNKNEIFGHKISKERSLEIYVNGIKVNTYENTPLFPESRIQIVYK